MPPSFSTLASKSNPSLVATIRRGVPASMFAAAAEAVGITQEELARKLRVGRRTIARKAKAHQRLSSEETEKLLRISRVRNLAGTLFTDDDAAVQWLKTPAPALDGAAPLDLLDTDVGASAVEELLLGAGHGQVV